MSVDAISWAFQQNIKPAVKKFVLVALADNADTYGICFPSFAHLAEKTGLSRRAVMNNCNALVDEGIIQKSGRVRGNQSHTSNAYLLPIIKGEISDHPLAILFPTPSERDSLPLVNEVHHLVNEVHYPSERGSPPEPSINHHLTKREREPLTREEFLRGANQGFQDGEFSEEFEHLTETEIARQAEECFDRWGDNLTGRHPVYILRSWLRKGQSLGTVRKAPKEKDACQGEPVAEPENELQDWHRRLKPVLDDGVFKSWIRPLVWDGNGTIQAPSAFHATHVKNHFLSEITKATHSGVKIHHKPQKGA